MPHALRVGQFDPEHLRRRPRLIDPGCRVSIDTYPLRRPSPPALFERGLGLPHQQANVRWCHIGERDLAHRRSLGGKGDSPGEHSPGITRRALLDYRSGTDQPHQMVPRRQRYAAFIGMCDRGAVPYGERLRGRTRRHQQQCAEPKAWPHSGFLFGPSR